MFTRRTASCAHLRSLRQCMGGTASNVVRLQARPRRVPAAAIHGLVRTSRLSERVKVGCNERTVPARARRRLSAEADAAVGAGAEVAVTRRQLMHQALYSAIPMVGFGIMDNLVMIQAGDAIDNSIGVTLGLHTLTAAAFGQIFSDLSGVTFGGTVEAAVSKMGLRAPALTAAQRATTPVRVVSTAGAAVGVVVGCLIGMTSLLFMDLDKADRLKREEELDTIFETILDITDTFEAEQCSLFMVDEEKEVLWSRLFDGTVRKAAGDGRRGRKKGVITLPLSAGVTGRAVRDQKLMIVDNAYEHPDFDPWLDKQQNRKTKTLLVGPVIDEDGKTAAVVTLWNKKPDPATGAPRTFTENDVKLMKMLTTHIAAFLRHV